MARIRASGSPQVPSPVHGERRGHAVRDAKGVEHGSDGAEVVFQAVADAVLHDQVRATVAQGVVDHLEGTLRILKVVGGVAGEYHVIGLRQAGVDVALSKVHAIVDAGLFGQAACAFQVDLRQVVADGGQSGKSLCQPDQRSTLAAADVGNMGTVFES